MSFSCMLSECKTVQQFK